LGSHTRTHGESDASIDRRHAHRPHEIYGQLSGGVTGEIHYVDSGYNVTSMPRPDELKADGQV
jgi:hypothetical protein